MQIEPFLIYAVHASDGTMKHSSIIYCNRLKPGVTLSPDELAEMLLTSADYASQDHEWPEHGSGRDNDLTLSIYGPFFPGDAVNFINGAAYHAIDEDDLP